MAAPTAIPHSEHSLHHHNGSRQETLSPSPNRNSPPPFSPIYTRTAFSLPGAPIGSPTSNFRNTASGWSTAGAGVNGRLRSPPLPQAVESHHKVQRDYFPERDVADNGSTGLARHHRAFSTSSASTMSSVADSGGPPTPNGSLSASTGAPLGRVPSIPIGSSYESLKNKRDSWAGSYSHGAGWAGLGKGFRPQGPKSPVGANSGLGDAANPNVMSSDAQGAANGGGTMGGIFRKLSLSGGANRPTHGRAGHLGQRSASISTTAASAEGANWQANGISAQRDGVASNVDGSDGQAIPAPRGRQGSMNGGSAKRKPSPHGERLLMGWTHAH